VPARPFAEAQAVEQGGGRHGCLLTRNGRGVTA